MDKPLEILDNGKRKQRLKDSFEIALQEGFPGRILVFDKLAADEAAFISAEKRKFGRSIEIRDAMICGIARVRHAGVATRNVKNFEGTKVSIINPWEL